MPPKIGQGGGGRDGGHFKLAAARPTMGVEETASTGGGGRACGGTADRSSGGAGLRALEHR